MEAWETWKSRDKEMVWLCDSSLSLPLMKWIHSSFSFTSFLQRSKRNCLVFFLFHEISVSLVFLNFVLLFVFGKVVWHSAFWTTEHLTLCTFYTFMCDMKQKQVVHLSPKQNCSEYKPQVSLDSLPFWIVCGRKHVIFNQVVLECGKEALKNIREWFREVASVKGTLITLATRKQSRTIIVSGGNESCQWNEAQTDDFWHAALRSLCKHSETSEIITRSESQCFWQTYMIGRFRSNPVRPLSLPYLCVAVSLTPTESNGNVKCIWTFMLGAHLLLMESNHLWIVKRLSRLKTSLAFYSDATETYFPKCIRQKTLPNSFFSQAISRLIQVSTRTAIILQSFL